MNNDAENVPRWMRAGVQFTPPPPGFESLYPVQTAAAIMQATALTQTDIEAIPAQQQAAPQESLKVPTSEWAQPAPAHVPSMIIPSWLLDDQPHVYLPSPRPILGTGLYIGSQVESDEESPSEHPPMEEDRSSQAAGNLSKAKTATTQPQLPPKQSSSNPKLKKPKLGKQVPHVGGTSASHKDDGATAVALSGASGYTCADLIFPGVIVCNAYFQAAMAWCERPRRCFRYKLIAYSATAAVSVVKLFLGPRQPADVHEYAVLRRSRQAFVELDCFTYRLVRGVNAMRRYSVDFRGRMDHRDSHTRAAYKLYYFIAPYPQHLLAQRVPSNFEDASGIYAETYPLDKPIHSDWFHILHNGYLQDCNMFCQ